MGASNMLGGFLDFIGEGISNIFKGPLNFIGNLFEMLCQYVLQGLRWLLSLIYQLFRGICYLVDFAETVFKKVAGLDTIYLNGVQYGADGKDLVYGFITNESVMDIFWSIMALSIVLLFVFTIVAMIKSEFTLDLKGAAKGPIISRAFKSAVNLIAVPAVAIIAIFATNFLTQTIYQLFDGDGTTLSAKCFQIAAYTANRARNDKDFVQYINDGEWLDGSSNPFSGSQETMADTIDKYFMEGLNPNITFYRFGAFERAERNDDDEDAFVDWFTLLIGYPDPGDPCSRADIKMVNYFYELTQFQYVLGIGSAVAIAWTMLTVCLVLLKRVFELTILFLLAPPMVAIAPLDGGQAEKKWRQEFMKRLLSVIGTVFAYNMYFLLVPIFETISIFSSGSSAVSAVGAGAVALASPLELLGSAVSTTMGVVFDIFFQIICVFTGLSIVKSASALLSNLLGIEDLVKSGGEAAKKAIDTGKKAVMTTAALAVGGAHVAGTAAKIIGRTAGAAAHGAGWIAGHTVGKTKLGQAVASKAADARDWLQEHGPGSGVRSAQADYNTASDAADEAQKDYDTKSSRLKALNEMDVLTEDEANERDALAASLPQAKANLQKMLNDKATASENLASASKKSIIGRVGGIFINNEHASQAILDRGEAELLGVDKNSDVYKARQEQIDKEAEKARMSPARKAMAAVKKNRFVRAVTDSFVEEWGEHSDETSFIGGLSKKAAEATKNIPFLRSATKTMHDLLGANASTILRRFNDSLSGLAGDAAGDLVKFMYNPNARASWFENIPESKKRQARIDNEMTMEARNNFEKKEAEKAAKKKEIEAAKRMYAEEFAKAGNADARRLRNIYQRLDEGGLSNPEKEKLKIEAAELEVKGGTRSITRSAEKYLEEATDDSDKLKRLSKYKDMMQQDAATAAYKEEKKAKQRATAAAAAVDGRPPEQKIAESSINELAKAFVNQMQGGKGFKINTDSKVKIDATSLTEGINDMRDVLQQFITELQKAKTNGGGGGG